MDTAGTESGNLGSRDLEHSLDRRPAGSIRKWQEPMSEELFSRGARLTHKIIELQNSVLTARLIVKFALSNPVSTGCHYIE